MRITAVEEFGLRCLLSLAKEGAYSQLSIADIAEREGISVPYASKLLSLLRKANLVVAVRGRTGGFTIARHPSEITLFEVLTTLGGPLLDPNHCTRYSGLGYTCVHIGDCSIHPVLVGLAGYLKDFLSGTTIEDLINRDTLASLKRKVVTATTLGLEARK